MKDLVHTSKSSLVISLVLEELLLDLSPGHQNSFAVIRVLMQK